MYNVEKCIGGERMNKNLKSIIIIIVIIVITPLVVGTGVSLPIFKETLIKSTL